MYSMQLTPLLHKTQFKLRQIRKQDRWLQAAKNIATYVLDRSQWPSRIFILILIIIGVLAGAALHYRNTNLWQLKNLVDSFYIKRIGRRPIILGVFHRMQAEQNVDGNFAVIQFMGDVRQTHSLYCYYRDANDNVVVSRASIQRIHEGKRSKSDICAWAGHLAECDIGNQPVNSIQISTRSNDPDPMTVHIEKPVFFEERHSLVVCFAPLYVYTEWQLLLLGIENWLLLGATKIIVPIQSVSKTAYLILKQYEQKGKVIIRHWPQWPVLSDTNPNGLVLSRGIEESHVNCLFFAKPFAKLIVFTDIDDMLIPINPSEIRPTANLRTFENLMKEYPQAGSFLFEHKDVQLILPESKNPIDIQQFNFNFLLNTKWKSKCSVRRIKTRVVVVASKVDSVNMHETGIHRFGAVQVRVPCRRGHFFHLRHDTKNMRHESRVDLSSLVRLLNESFERRLQSTFQSIFGVTLNRTTTESFKMFDRCMASISAEYFHLHISRCLTPHVCYSNIVRDVDCLAVSATYEFSYFDGDYVIVLNSTKFVRSEPNCEAPASKYTNGDHFYIP